MTRWIIWSIMLISTSGTSTLASRARNTPSYKYHAFAAMGSHGTFFISNLIGIDVLVEVIRTHNTRLAVIAFLIYAVSSTTGSVLSHFIAMRYLEHGNTRVGAYEEGHQ